MLLAMRCECEDTYVAPKPLRVLSAVDHFLRSVCGLTPYESQADRQSLVGGRNNEFC